MSALSRAIHSILNDCLRIRRGESLLILVDSPLSALGYQFYQEAQLFTKKPSLIVLPRITNHSCEPPRNIASYMRTHDVIILLTSCSLSHTNARRRATQRGARVASLPSVTKESLIRTLTGNYRTLIDKSRKIADILTIGRSAHLTNPSGTDLTFSLTRMKGYSDTGMIHEPGKFSNLPAGEACAAPVQGSTQGLLIIDGSFPMIGRITQPVQMSVKNGQVVRITGDEEARKIRKLLRPYGKLGRNIAEIGIGTNPKAKITGCVLEDEKVLGTVHIGLGNNISFGGKVSVGCHFDGVLLKPTLTIDGKTILEDGELQV
jgi:leucyl aminopeptidase (aminopeptidase T)